MIAAALLGLLLIVLVAAAHVDVIVSMPHTGRHVRTGRHARPRPPRVPVILRLVGGTS